MIRKLTPYENKKLIATKNMLSIDGTATQTVSIPYTNINWNRTGPFDLSFCMLYTTPGLLQNVVEIVTPLSAQGMLIEIRADNFLQMSLRNNGNIYINIFGFTNILPNVLYRVRVKVTYVGNVETIETFLNGRSLGTIDADFGVPIPTWGGVTELRVGGAGGIKVFDLITMTNTFTDLEYDAMHLTGVIPNRLHPDVRSHHSFNQSFGPLAFDMVEQYNYAKVIPLDAIHGALNNFVETDGHTNPLVAEAWQNVYTKKQKGTQFLQFDGVNSYLELAGDTFSEWTLMLDIADINTIADSNILINKATDAANPDLLILKYLSAGSPGLQLYLGNAVTPAMGVSLVGFDPSKRNVILIWCDTEVRMQVFGIDYAYTSAVIVSGTSYYLDTFTIFNLSSATQYAQYFANKMAKFCFYERALNTGERTRLVKSYRSDAYLSIADIYFALDLGALFLSGGDYYAKDQSGNARHAEVINFDLADSPFNLEIETSLPQAKALIFDSTLGNYLSIAGFMPTKEQGYTHIIGVSLDSDRAPTAQEAFISKFDGSKFKVIRGETVGEIRLYDSEYATWVAIDSISTNDITYYVSTQKSSYVDLGHNGFKETTDVSEPDITGYNEVTGDLWIGTNTLANGKLNGYVYFVGIWKGILTNEQIRNIVNNTLGANYLANTSELYLTFEDIVDNGGTPQIKDWSPNGYNVVLNNYSPAQLDPMDPDFAITDLDLLR